MKMKIYIPFSGMLKFDCARCPWKCCDYRNIFINKAKEGKLLFERYPRLKYLALPPHRVYLPFALSKKAEKHIFATAVVPCSFLDDKGLCSLQRRGGYDLKPLGCRTYPYYLSRVGDDFIVRVCMDVFCPITLARRNEGLKKQPYLILSDLEESIGTGLYSSEIPWSKQRLLFEKRLFKDSKRFLDKRSYVDYAVHQLQRAYKERTPKRVREALMEKIRLWQGFLKIEDNVLENKQITHELTVLTGLLRVEAHAMDEKVVPLVLMALYVLMALSPRRSRQASFVYSYSVRLKTAMNLAFLRDDLDTRKELLLCARENARCRLGLAKSHTLLWLADGLKWNVKDRILFLNDFLAKGNSPGGR